MDYRSDWPELGLASSSDAGKPSKPPPRPDDADTWERETRERDLSVRWTASRNAFESGLYGCPMWDLRVEAHGAARTSGGPFLAVLEERLTVEAARLLDTPAWRSVYLYSKAVRGEPLHGALSRLGFPEVEQRRLYKTPVKGLAGASSRDVGGGIRFATLADIDPARHDSCRGQILDLCREAFAEGGHSRHFTDPFLRERVPGLGYILTVMELNFDRLTPADFLVAVDPDSDTVCGFSVLEKKAGVPGNLYTQLLSAVRRGYRGRGIYQGITALLRRRLPPDAILLNVTHVENRAMQRAYQQSGRVHLADTAVLRRVPPEPRA